MRNKKYIVFNIFKKYIRVIQNLTYSRVIQKITLLRLLDFINQSICIFFPSSGDTGQTTTILCLFLVATDFSVTSCWPKYYEVTDTPISFNHSENRALDGFWPLTMCADLGSRTYHSFLVNVLSLSHHSLFHNIHNYCSIKVFRNHKVYCYQLALFIDRSFHKIIV